jgi:hypothetical protein
LGCFRAHQAIDAMDTVVNTVMEMFMICAVDISATCLGRGMPTWP